MVVFDGEMLRVIVHARTEAARVWRDSRSRTSWSLLRSGSRSPASGSRTNWSYGRIAVERRDDPIAVAVAFGGIGKSELSPGGGRRSARHPANVGPSVRRTRASRAAARRLWRKRRVNRPRGTRRFPSGVGGRPVRSYVARRISVRLSARARASSPRIRCAREELSMSLAATRCLSPRAARRWRAAGNDHHWRRLGPIDRVFGLRGGDGGRRCADRARPFFTLR